MYEVPGRKNDWLCLHLILLQKKKNIVKYSFMIDIIQNMSVERSYLMKANPASPVLLSGFFLKHLRRKLEKSCFFMYDIHYHQYALFSYFCTVHHFDYFSTTNLSIPVDTFLIIQLLKRIDSGTLTHVNEK